MMYARSQVSKLMTTGTILSMTHVIQQTSPSWHNILPFFYSKNKSPNQPESNTLALSLSRLAWGDFHQLSISIYFKTSR